jgi:putative transposase
LDGLRPVRRADTGAVRRHPRLLAEAAALRTERPARSAAHIAEILRARHGIQVSERTIRAHLRRKGLDRAALAAEPARAFGRYEAERPNERWIGDVLVGPFVPHPRVAGSQRARLFLLVDDHSRLLVHGRWVTEENTRAGQEVLRQAVVRRGLPEQLYVDNGAPYANQMLERSCAVLGIRLVHSKPYQPQGRGKQERLNRVIRERFLLEAEAVGIGSLEELNDRFAAWAEQVCNTRVHAETGQPPIARWQAGGPPRAADPVLLAEAFRWSVTRVVAKTATVSLAGNRYQVDPSLVGQHIELRYDPEDLTQLTVYMEGAAAGIATPLVVGRHTHPAVPQAARPTPEPTGIDYLGLVQAAHEQATIGRIAYRDLQALAPPQDTAEVQEDP